MLIKKQKNQKKRTTLPNESEAPVNENLLSNDKSKVEFSSKKKFILLVSSIALCSIVFFVYKENDSSKKITKKPTAPVVTPTKEVIYKTTLDNSVKTKNHEIEVAYPFGTYKQTNTVFYAFNIINNLDIITIDPTGDPFPSDSQKLSNLPSISLGTSYLAINLDSLPKQNYFIRLVTKNNNTLLTTQHYFLSNNPFERTIRLNNLKAGGYYIQALNLVTHATYVSTPFYLSSSGEIVSGQNIGFERIDTVNIFGLPENNEISPLAIDDIPIILNDRYDKEKVDEESPFEKAQ